MSSPQFNVVLKGVLPGFDSEKAQADFATLFSLDAEKAANLFAIENSILKANITQEVADKYLSRLAAIGVSATAEPVFDETVANKADANEIIVDEPSINESLSDAEASSINISKASDDEENSGFARDNSSLAITQELPSVSLDKNVQQQKQHHAFTFTGNGTEYFKIWIVNILLSIVTLGIYSAWAKVRNKQYFYGNTHIAGHTFEYTAEPIKILKGRAIAFAIYVAWGAANYISPLASVAAAIIFMLFIPFIITNSLKFNARHSSYRNIPFRFTGTIWGAAKAFILLPIAGIFTLGLMFPLAWKRQTQYITNNHYYGNEPFSFNVDIKEYFFLLMILAGVSMGFFMVISMLIAGVSVASVFGGSSFDSSSWLIMVPMFLGYILFYLAIGAYYVVRMANIHWNNTKLQNHQFTANWATPSYMKLLTVNTFGILCTLGLFIPFAKVRTAIYKANHTAFIAEGDLDSFIANELEHSNSLAEGVHDIFDIDISI
ncbi:MAG: YjgN family protein [Cellvibrio sp.]